MNDVKLDELSMARMTRSYTSSTPARPVVAEEQAGKRHQENSTVHDQAVSRKEKTLPGLIRSDAQRDSQPRVEATRQEKVREAVIRLNEYVQSIQRDLTFEYDEVADTTVIKVLDRKTQEVVRQIPDEVALTLARNLQQDEPLILFNAKV